MADMSDGWQWRENINADVAHLQEVMLNAVAFGQLLPGLTRPVLLPEGCSFRGDTPCPLLRDTLSKAFNLKQLPTVFRPVTVSEYWAESQQGRYGSFLAFNPPDVRCSRIRLVITANRGRPGGDPPLREVASLEAEFHLADHRWEAVGMPSLFIQDDLDRD
jgi:hypothetical protein